MEAAVTNAITIRRSDTVRRLGKSNPISIDQHLTLQEATAFLETHGISVAIVVNDAGRPLGILSRADIIRVTKSTVNTPQMLGDFINEAITSSGSERPVTARIQRVKRPIDRPPTWIHQAWLAGECTGCGW